jgi:hypothetical protein
VITTTLSPFLIFNLVVISLSFPLTALQVPAR